MNTFFWLLIGLTTGHTSPATLAVLNDKVVCEKAAREMVRLSKADTGPVIRAYCIEVPAKALERK